MTVIAKSKKRSLVNAIVLPVFAASAMFGLSGCAQDGSGISKTALGGIIGAVGGAVIGKNVGKKNKRSALIGAALGGMAGAGAGYYMDKQQKELEAKLAREQAEKKIAIEKLQNNVIKVSLDSSATFAVGKSNLNSNFNSSLRKIADSLRSNNKTAVHVIGHTDSTGSDSNNQALSESRAYSVQNFLSQNGVDSQRLRAQGLGERNPVADNTTSSGRRQNRRVEIYLKPIITGQEQQAFVSPVN